MRRSVLSSLALASALMLMLASSAFGAPNHRTIQILDNCDGPSFNEALGPGACSRPGGLSFENLERSFARGGAPSWRFSPSQGDAGRGWVRHRDQPGRRVPHLHRGCRVRRRLRPADQRRARPHRRSGVRGSLAVRDHRRHPGREPGGRADLVGRPPVPVPDPSVAAGDRHGPLTASLASVGETPAEWPAFRFGAARAEMARYPPPDDPAHRPGPSPVRHRRQRPARTAGQARPGGSGRTWTRQPHRRSAPGAAVRGRAGTSRSRRPSSRSGATWTRWLGRPGSTSRTGSSGTGCVCRSRIDRAVHYEIVGRTFAALPPETTTHLRIVTVRARPNEEARLIETLRERLPQLVEKGLVASHLGRRVVSGEFEAVTVGVWPDEETLQAATGGGPERPLFEQELSHWSDRLQLETYDGIEIAPRLPAASGPPIFILDDQLRIVDVTATAAAALGREPDDLVGRSLQELSRTDPEEFARNVGLAAAPRLGRRGGQVARPRFGRGLPALRGVPGRAHPRAPHGPRPSLERARPDGRRPRRRARRGLPAQDGQATGLRHAPGAARAPEQQGEAPPGGGASDVRGG